MKTESEYKTAVVKQVRDDGGYGRRFEDQYAVGIPDTLLAPKGGLVFMAEFKIIRSATFGPTPRQYVELTRIENVDIPSFVPMMIGCSENTLHLHKATRECSPYSAVCSGHYKTITKLLLEFQEKMFDGRPQYR